MFGTSVGWWLAETEPALVGGVFAIDTPPSRFDGTLDPEAAEAATRSATLRPSASRR